MTTLFLGVATDTAYRSDSPEFHRLIWITVDFAHPELNVHNDQWPCSSYRNRVIVVNRRHEHFDAVLHVPAYQPYIFRRLIRILEDPETISSFVLVVRSPDSVVILTLPSYL